MNRSLLFVVCDFLLLSILALARFDVPKDAVIAQDDQKVVSKEVIERYRMAKIMTMWLLNWKQPMKPCWKTSVATKMIY